jgi:putative transposase
MVDAEHKLSVRTQCQLLQLNRSSVYYKRQNDDSADDALKSMINEIYLASPVYGYRRIKAKLASDGEVVNAKRIRRLMKAEGLKAIYPRPRTTIVNRNDCKQPYLLKDLKLARAHQVWQVDITYVPTDRGFMYLTALIDVYSRYVVGYALSNSMEASDCIRALEHALLAHHAPEIINSDQGCQFTSDAWLQALAASGITASMSGKGRSNDNAHIERLWRTYKYEWLMPHGRAVASKLKTNWREFLAWYHCQRPHQSLGYLTPQEMIDNHKAHGYVENASPSVSRLHTYPQALQQAKREIVS